MRLPSDVAEQVNEFRPLHELPRVEVALTYAAAGFPVFPLAPGTKVPAIAGGKGYLDATTNTDQIRAWWTRWPAANIGIPTGAASGLLVVDPDTYKPGASEAWAAWQSEHGRIPPTLRVLTPQGGTHHWYVMPDGVDVRNGKPVKDVDVRGNGGYVTAPGSVVDDVPYVFAHDDMYDADLTAPDDVVLDLVGHRTNGSRATERHLMVVAELPEVIPDGQGRTDNIVSLAGTMRRRSMTADEMLPSLLAFDETRNVPPLGPAKVRKIAESIARYEPGDAPVDMAGKFFDRNKLVVKRLADHIADDTPVALGHDGRLYRYVDGVWRSDGEAHVRRRVRDLLGDRFVRRHQDEVLAYFRADHAVIGDDQPARWINVPNGLLDWRSGELLPHDADVHSTIRVPVAWNPDAACPAIDEFLGQVLPDRATVEFMYEAFGYALLADNPLRKALLFLGSGGNGKTITLTLLKELIGDRNVSAVPLQTLTENRFAVAELFGMLANICGDLDARAVRQSDMFKAITGGDLVRAERKYGHGFNFVAYSLLVFSANEPPLSSDQTMAWFDRWIVVPFGRRFEGADAIPRPKLLAALTTDAELEGLLVRSVAGLRRLMDRGRFDLPEAVRGAGNRYRDRLDSVRGFVDEMCVVELGEGWVAKSDLYRTYAGWCKDGGRHALNAGSFNERLAQDYGEAVVEKTRKGSRGWGGIRFRAGGEER